MSATTPISTVFQTRYLDESKQREVEYTYQDPEGSSITKKIKGTESQISARLISGIHVDHVNDENHKRALISARSRFLETCIPEKVIWKQDAVTGRFTFIVPPFEKNSTTVGTDHQLIQLLKYCKTNKIQADIIASVAEKSPRAFISRSHFVTYHYKTGQDGKISDAKCYDSVRDMDNSGFTGVLSKIGNFFRRIVFKKPKRFFSVDQQESMQQSIQSYVGDGVTINRHYAGVQKNDIDCGYWSAVIAMKLAESPDTSKDGLFESLRSDDAKQRMLHFKEMATRDNTVKQVGVEYQEGMKKGETCPLDQIIDDYAVVAHVRVGDDQIPKDLRTNCSTLMGVIIADLVDKQKIGSTAAEVADTAAAAIATVHGSAVTPARDRGPVDPAVQAADHPRRTQSATKTATNKSF